MPLRVRLAQPSTLAQLCRDLHAVADPQHHARELRSDGRTLYVKLRSACCLFSRDGARDTHRRRAVALVGECLGRDLKALGAADLTDRLLTQFLSGTGAGRPAPVRIADVLALERVVERAHRLAAHLPSYVAVKTAAACVLETRPARPVAAIPPSLATVSTPSASQRAAELLSHARRIADGPAGLAGSRDPRPALPGEFLHLAASFTADDLLTPQEIRLHDSFVAQARPLLEKAGPAWQAFTVPELATLVEQLVHLHRVTFGYDAVEVQFDRRLREAPAWCAPGAPVVLPTRQPDDDDAFDEFVHHLVHGLTLRYQHHLAARLPPPGDPGWTLACLMRAHQLVPMDRHQLARRYDIKWTAAREAWLTSPSYRHANALADRVSALAYAALPDGKARLPRLAEPGKHG